MSKFKPAAWPRQLRSQHWYGGTSRDTIYHRGWMKNQGHPHDLFDGRPVIGILNTWSDLTPCNGHLRELAEKVKAGVWEAGGFPVEVPVFSASENTFRPTAMMYRNLAALAVEEAMRGQPIDGAVLLVGCDKTTPSLVMGAASTDIPSIVVTGGPMLNGYFRGERVGSGTHLWKFSEAVKAGEMTQAEFAQAEASMSRSPGSCNTMGTASTMASMMESLGMTLSGNAAIPAVDSRRRVMAHMTGMRIVQMVKDDLKPSDILKKENFENAIRTNGAIGGSTNAVIHLLAIAGRVGIDLTLDDWDRCGREVSTIVNLMPSGKYLMEEFFYAGGLPVVIKRLGEAGLLHKDALTVSGGPIWDEVKDVVNYNEDVILPADRPLTAHGGIAVLKGNLAPKGAVLKPSAASPGSTASVARTSESRRRARSAPTKSGTKSLAGAASSWSGVSYWTSRPSFRIATTSPIRIASSMSWVTRITVFFSRFRMARNSSCRRPRTIGSTAPNGSSISITGGSAASARATPTRWRCPPERWRG